MLVEALQIVVRRRRTLLDAKEALHSEMEINKLSVDKMRTRDDLLSGGLVEVVLIRRTVRVGVRAELRLRSADQGEANTEHERVTRRSSNVQSLD